MRLFYSSEGPIDTLLQIAACPVGDGDLVSKGARDVFVQLNWVARCHGWNVITEVGRKAIHSLALRRVEPSAMGCAVDQAAPEANHRRAAFEALQRIMVEIDKMPKEMPGIGMLTKHGAGCILSGLEQAGFTISRAE